MAEMTPQGLLLKAADHIERYGLIRGNWVPDRVADRWFKEAPQPDCPACVGGALAIEVSGGRDFSPNFVRRPSEKRTMERAIDLLLDHLYPGAEADGPDPLDYVIEWSDSTPQDEVVASLRAAAGKAS